MKVFDAQTLQREVEARRSGSPRQAASGAENEKAPAADQFSAYPPLDRNALRNGYKLCVENAKRLIPDARALAEAARYRSAHRILLMVLEELGSALQLYEAARGGVQDWEEWWRRYHTHPKELQSPALGIEKREDSDERFRTAPEEIAHVAFDKKYGKFVAPVDDEDPELVAFFEKEAEYAESVLKALPSHAFERWDYELMIRQSPEIAPLVLYARIEEILVQEPSANVDDLLVAIAKDLGRSKDVFAAGFERWKEIAPKARAYIDLMRGLQEEKEE